MSIRNCLGHCGGIVSNTRTLHSKWYHLNYLNADQYAVTYESNLNIPHVNSSLLKTKTQVTRVCFFTAWSFLNAQKISLMLISPILSMFTCFDVQVLCTATLDLGEHYPMIASENCWENFKWSVILCIDLYR